MLQFVKCFNSEFHCTEDDGYLLKDIYNKLDSISRSNYNSILQFDSIHLNGNINDKPKLLTPPTNLYQLIKWLSPSFQMIQTLSQDVNDSKQPKTKRKKLKSSNNGNRSPHDFSSRLSNIQIAIPKTHAIVSINSLTVSPIAGTHSVSIHKQTTRTRDQLLHHQRSISHQSPHLSHAYNTSPYLKSMHKSPIHNRIKWTVSGLDHESSDSKEDHDQNEDGEDYQTRKRSIKYSTYSESDDDDSFKLLNDTDDDKEVEENSYYHNRKHKDSNATTVTFVDNSSNSRSESRSVIQEEKEMDIRLHLDPPTDDENFNYAEGGKSDEDEISTIYNMHPFEFGVLLSEQFESQMRRYRLYTLLKITEFKLHIYPEGLLKDIINVIVEFELGIVDIQQFTVNILNKEIRVGISSYIGYFLGCFESLCMFAVILIHAYNWYQARGGLQVNQDYYLQAYSPFLGFQLMILSWCIVLLIHIIGAIVLWRRGHRIAQRLKELKIAMKVSHIRNIDELHNQELRLRNDHRLLHNHYNHNHDRYRYRMGRHHHTYSDTNDDVDIEMDEGEGEEDEDEDEDIFTDIHIGEAFARLQRWCNLSEIRLNDKFNSVKILMLVLQKYILPLSIALCILTDPSGNKWYAYISILAYYLHLHILYEIFHNERHAMVAFARVTLFWGIFISIVAAIASATSAKDGHDKNGDNSSSSSEANFLAGLAGALLFGIFIAVFDVCWFFSDNPAKKRLIFFVILVNGCYIGGLLYMFGKSLRSIIIITLFFTISLIHCQIVFNQIIDCVLYGDLDNYLDLPIPNKFFINSYYQTFIGMTNTNNVEINDNVTH